MTLIDTVPPHLVTPRLRNCAFHFSNKRVLTGYHCRQQVPPPLSKFRRFMQIEEKIDGNWGWLLQQVFKYKNKRNYRVRLLSKLLLAVSRSINFSRCEDRRLIDRKRCGDRKQRFLSILTLPIDVRTLLETIWNNLGKKFEARSS